jgi:hypothetical protein
MTRFGRHAAAVRRGERRKSPNASCLARETAVMAPESDRIGWPPSTTGCESRLASCPGQRTAARRIRNPNRCPRDLARTRAWRTDARGRRHGGEHADRGLAFTRGLVSVVAVLGSLYPVALEALARGVLHERIARHQLAGRCCGARRCRVDQRGVAGGAKGDDCTGQPADAEVGPHPAFKQDAVVDWA